MAIRHVYFARLRRLLRNLLQSRLEDDSPVTEQILFLFGSKVSKAPDVWEITRAFSTRAPASVGYERLIPDLFCRLRLYAAQQRGLSMQDVHYEDVGELLNELHNGSIAVRPLLDAITKEFATRLRRDQRASFDIDDLISATLSYLTETVGDLLRGCEDTSALESFFRLVRSQGDDFSVVTTNHDLLIESALEKCGYRPNLGFANSKPTPDSLAPVGNIPFDPEILRAEDGPKVLKLHGSVDWCNGTPEQGGDATVVRAPRHVKNPVVIVGGTNKLADYNFLIFPHLFCEFQNLLYRTDRIVVSGYGFKDEGINVRILDWLERRNTRRVLIIHHEEEELRTQIEAMFPQNQSGRAILEMPRSRVTFLPAKFEEIPASGRSDEIVEFCQPARSLP